MNQKGFYYYKKTPSSSCLEKSLLLFDDLIFDSAFLKPDESLSENCCAILLKEFSSVSSLVRSKSSFSAFNTMATIPPIAAPARIPKIMFDVFILKIYYNGLLPEITLNNIAIIAITRRM